GRVQPEAPSACFRPQMSPLRWNGGNHDYEGTRGRFKPRDRPAATVRRSDVRPGLGRTGIPDGRSLYFITTTTLLQPDRTHAPGVSDACPRAPAAPAAKVSSTR